MVREKLKKSEEDIEFSGTVSQLRDLLIRKYPELEPILKVVRFAVNEEYVDEDYFIGQNDRVAIIPPVSGG